MSDEALEKPINLKVAAFVSDYLDKAKSEGLTKKGVLVGAITFFKWFNNRASYRVTKENVIALELLKAIRVDMVQKGANNEELLKLDDAISAVNAVLKRLEDVGEKKR